MNTTFSTTRESQGPLTCATRWTHTEPGVDISIGVNLPVKASSPRTGALELEALQFAIALLQGRADVLQQEAENT